MAFNLAQQTSIEFKHTPYIVILVQAIKKWKEEVSYNSDITYLFPY
jgi:hypothetical protein